MSEPKPLASLNGNLLARKGGAKPAMRSQLMQPYAAPGANGTESANQLEDLGWNDIGGADEHRHPSDILPLTPAPANPEAEAEAKAEDRIAAAQLAENAERLASGLGLHEPTEKPAVLRQQEEIETRLAAQITPAIEPKPDHLEERSLPVEKPQITEKPQASVRRRSSPNGSRRAAFTLRLDGDRHLMLRLACTVRNRSAQQVVTEALDRFLGDMPEIQALADQVKKH